MNCSTVKRIAWVLIGCLVLSLAWLTAVGAHPAEVDASPADLPPLRAVTIALGPEPESLSPFSEDSLTAYEVRNAVMDLLFTNLDYAVQATILTGLPDLANDDAAIEQVMVTTGDTILDAGGSVTTLTNGTDIRPAGCTSAACAVMFAGTPVAMDRIVATYTLRSNIRWSDGQTLTSGDSTFGKAIACDPDTNGNTYLCDRTAAYDALDGLKTRWTVSPATSITRTNRTSGCHCPTTP